MVAFYFFPSSFSSCSSQSNEIRLCNTVMGKSSVLQYLQYFTIPMEGNSSSGEDASLFLSWLADDLKTLEQSLSSGPISLQWSTQAMGLLKKMQIELFTLLKNSNLPISYGSKEDWFDHYMQETTTLLDFCNSLKSAVSGINRFCMLVDVAVRDHDDSNGRLIELEELEMVFKKNFDIKIIDETLRLKTSDTRSYSSNKKLEKNVIGVMHAAKSTMVVLSLLVFSTIVSSVVPLQDTNYRLLDNKKLQPLFAMLSSLLDRYQENMSDSTLPEHEELGRLVKELKEQAMHDIIDDKEKFQNNVALLRMKSSELKEGVEIFDAVVDEVFDVVIKGRHEMLGAFRHGAF